MARLLAAMGIGGALALLVIELRVVSDWGPPGTGEYELYALVNRLTGVALALAVAAPASLWSALGRGGTGARGARRALVVTAIALVGMVAGSVAEFWVFNDRPYRGTGSELRNVSWMTFLASALVLAAGSVIAGLLLLRRSPVPRWAGVAVAVAAPFGIAAAAAGAPPLVAIPLVALALSVATLSLGRQAASVAHPD